MATEPHTIPYASPLTAKPRRYWAVITSFCLTGFSALGFAALVAFWNWGPSHGRTGDEEMGASIAIGMMSLPFIGALMVSFIFAVVGISQSRGSWMAWVAAALSGGPFLVAAVGFFMK